MTGPNNYEDWKYDDLAKQDWNHPIIPKQGDRKYDDLAEQEDWKALCRAQIKICLLYTSPSPRDQLSSRMPSSA